MAQEKIKQLQKELELKKETRDENQTNSGMALIANYDRHQAVDGNEISFLRKYCTNKPSRCWYSNRVFHYKQ